MLAPLQSLCNPIHLALPLSNCPICYLNSTLKILICNWWPFLLLLVFQYLVLTLWQIEPCAVWSPGESEMEDYIYIYIFFFDNSINSSFPFITKVVKDEWYCYILSSTWHQGLYGSAFFPVGFTTFQTALHRQAGACQHCSTVPSLKAILPPQF